MGVANLILVFQRRKDKNHGEIKAGRHESEADEEDGKEVRKVLTTVFVRCRFQVTGREEGSQGPGE